MAHQDIRWHCETLLAPLPSQRLRRELRTIHYRGHGYTHIRIFLRHRRTGPIRFQPTTRVIKLAAARHTWGHSDQPQVVKCSRAHRFEKHATPESRAWVEKQNREEEAFLVGLLSRH